MGYRHGLLLVAALLALLAGCTPNPAVKFSGSYTLQAMTAEQK